MGANLIVLEEAAYHEEYVIKTIVMPMMSVSGTALFGISTLNKSPSNIYTKMVTSGLFNNYAVTLICDDCLKTGIREACKHYDWKIPKWFARGGNPLKCLFPTDDESNMRENNGIVDLGDNHCFSARLVDDFIAKPRRTLHENIRYVFTMVDPSAGSEVEGGLSDFAIISVCERDTILVGMEQMKVNNYSDYQGILERHIKKIRKIPHLENCVNILDVESGTGFEAGRLQDEARKCGDITCIDDFTRKPGSKTNHSMKAECVEWTKSILQNGKLSIHRDLVTHNTKPLEMLTNFADQLKNFEKFVVASKSNTVPNKYVYSGKGSNKNKKDDLSFTFLRGVRLVNLFFTNSSYRKYH